MSNDTLIQNIEEFQNKTYTYWRAEVMDGVWRPVDLEWTSYASVDDAQAACRKHNQANPTADKYRTVAVNTTHTYHDGGVHGSRT